MSDAVMIVREVHRWQTARRTAAKTVLYGPGGVDGNLTAALVGS